ncbi:MAG TPA: hypothetical protein VL307_01825 [Chitinophagaceae bacterium]|nr:hypothetical protein [Chitinophagaceae bacterium]
MKPTLFYSRKAFLNYALLLLALQCFLALCAQAQGNLMMMPRRVVFEGAKRYEELNLANTGKDTARYAISLMHVRMKEDGSFQEITSPAEGENFADKYIRFFPRAVTLGPGESQVIKIQLNRSSELGPGEYRSHLYFRAIPNQPILGETTASKDSSISIQLVPIFGISIPVIIRVGEYNTQVQLTNNSLQMEEDTIPVLNMTFTRSGNMSVYGDLAVDYIPEQGKTVTAGAIKGIAVYTPNTQRHIKFILNTAPGINYHRGRLHITYTSPLESGAIKIAETDLQLH